MDLIADILLISGALGAAFYCLILARRLNRFTNLENGVGGAIAVLSAQVDDMTRTLGQAQGSANGANASLASLTERAEDVARRLELLVASMHDLPDAGGSGTPPPAPPAEPDAAAHTVESSDTAPTDLFRSHRNWRREAAE